jgi:hypothetical protein
MFPVSGIKNDTKLVRVAKWWVQICLDLPFSQKPIFGRARPGDECVIFLFLNTLRRVELRPH